MECPGPAIPGSLGDMMEDGDMELMMAERGGRALTAGEEGDRIGDKRGGEVGETEVGVVADTPTAPAAATVAPDEDVLDEA